MIRFLHTADLHLGKPFGRFPEDLRGRLREARHASVAALPATRPTLVPKGTDTTAAV